MADWSKPALASSYANFVTETNARDTDLAAQFNPTYAASQSNLVAGTVQWLGSANKWRIWNGSVWNDLSSLYAINISGTAANVTGVVAAAKGGTGQSGYAIGDLLYASGTAALSKLAAVATGNVLLSGGAATAPTWGKVGLTTHVSGTLGVGNGGTGVAILTGVAYGNGVGAFTAATAAQLVAAIGTTPVANATNATNATTAQNGGVTSVNGQTGDVSIQGVPPGAVMHFAMTSPPTGWLAADGTAVSRSTYASLFSAIGTTFGVGNGTTTFNLPDLRGEFIRGYDNGRGVDSGRGIGTSQADMLKSHNHPIYTLAGASWVGTNGYTVGYGQGVSGWVSDKISAAGGTETRPRNIALLACIKF